ncbi:unnamed protein product [Victoria cruziana]
MVSIRRRKHLGMGPGSNTYLVQLPRYNEVTNDSGDAAKSIKLFDNSSTPINLNQNKEITFLEACPGSSNASGCSSSKEKNNHRSSLNSIDQVAGTEIKRRKRQRRKYFEDQEPCVMRGVYFKNMKWQAAIKVDKKQIHLGTVGSQEEAAHLYDRAAFMCGREPNFELSEEEKNELRSFDWEGFLAMTRSAITNKKHQKRVEAGSRKRTGSQTNLVDSKTNQAIDGLASSDVEVWQESVIQVSAMHVLYEGMLHDRRTSYSRKKCISKCVGLCVAEDLYNGEKNDCVLENACIMEKKRKLKLHRDVRNFQRSILYYAVLRHF